MAKKATCRMPQSKPASKTVAPTAIKSPDHVPETLRIFFFQAEDGIRDRDVTGVQTCALPISGCMNTPMRCAPCSSASRPANSKMLGASVCPSMKTMISPSSAPFPIVKGACPGCGDEVDLLLVIAAPLSHRGSAQPPLEAAKSQAHNHVGDYRSRFVSGS